MATKNARYAGRFIASAGLALTHGSNYATRDRLGNDVAANDPCFDDTCAFGNAPATPAVMMTSPVAGGAFCLTWGSGTWTDGTTPVVALIRSTGSTGTGNNVIRIGIGSNWSAGAFNSGTASPAANALQSGTGNRVFEWDIGCASGDAIGGSDKGFLNRADLLRGAGAENGEAVDVIYRPQNFWSAGGCMIAWCLVQKRASGTGVASVWENRTGAICQYDDSIGKWKLIYASTDTGNTRTRGSNWVNSYWTPRDKSQTNPTEVWAGFGDYLTGSLTGDVHLMSILRATRPNNASNAWTVQARDLMRFTSVAGNQHIHSVAICDLGVFISQGHVGQSSHVMVRWAVPWSWGGITGPASDADGVSQNGWTTDLKFSGKRDATVANRRDYNQAMAIAPSFERSHRKFLMSTDIGYDPYTEMTIPLAAGDKARFEIIRAGRGTSAFDSNYEVFGLSCDNNAAPSLVVSMKAGVAPGTTMPGIFAPGTWGTYKPIQKVMASRDGKRWFQVYACAEGIVREPKAVGQQVFFTVPSATGDEVRCLAVPSQAVGRPMLVDAEVSNYAVSSPLIAAPGGTNTTTDVTSTYFNANAISNGFTVPKCQSLNKVFRVNCDSSGGGFFDNFFITSEVNAVGGDTVPQGRPVIIFHTFVPPASVPFVNDTTAPYDETQCDWTFRIRRYVGGGGGTVSDLILNRNQGSGWTKHIYHPDISSDATWTSTLARFAFNFLSNQVTGRPCTILFSIEALMIGNTTTTAGGADRRTAIPCKPKPLLVTSSTNPILAYADTIRLTGFECGNSWTIAAALQMCDDAGDQYTYLIEPATQKLIHFANRNYWQSGTISVDFNVVNREFRFTDGTNTTTLIAQTGQEFELGRDTQIGIAISKANFSATQSTMNFAVFLGGCLVKTATATWSTRINPTEVVHADNTLAAVRPHRAHGVFIEDAVAMSEAQLAELLRNGNALTVPSTGQSNFSTIIFED